METLTKKRPVKMMKKKFELKKLNNKGSALVVVVIVIAFITILATLILYLSVMNFHMKGNDYRTKVSFYGAEEPLEELRACLAVDFANACDKSYKAVLVQYGNLVDGTGDARKAQFVGGIMTELNNLWTSRVNAAGSEAGGLSTTLRNTGGKYHVISGDENTLKCSDTGCTNAYHVILVDMPADPAHPGSLLPRFEVDEVTGKAVLNNIKAVYTKDGYTSVVSTDICFMIPEYDWSVEEAEDVWDDGPKTTERTKIDYEKCVVYLNWTKQ